MKDNYKILGIERSATKADIKKQFRKLARIHHPDKNGGSKESEERFKEILNAYETLFDDVNRSNYDIKQGQPFQARTNSSSKRQEAPQNKSQETKVNRPNQSGSHKPAKEKSNANYALWIIGLVIFFMFLYIHFSTSENNTKIEQQPENRPQSGEIKFKK